MKKDIEKEFHEGPLPPEMPACGGVMPISPIDGCDERHWSDVKDILFSAIEDAGFTPSLVSDADDVGVIHKRIIQNLYSNAIVVCDVSGKNPNVMFELSMRLAFDKPTIIVKDERTGYIFDTGAIEHLEYPRDLRFGTIVGFKAVLAKKIRGTTERAENDPNYTTFLKNVGEFKVAKIETKEVSKEDYIIDTLKELTTSVARLSRIGVSASVPKLQASTILPYISRTALRGRLIWSSSVEEQKTPMVEFAQKYVIDELHRNSITLFDKPQSREQFE